MLRKLHAARPMIVGFLFLLGCITTPPTNGQVFTIPTSEVVLYQEITLPNGEVARVSRVEGGLVTVEEVSGSVKYGFVARRDKSPAASASILMLDIFETPDFSRTVERTKFSVDKGGSNKIATPTGVFEVKFSGTDTAKPRTWYFPDGVLDLENAEQKALAIMFQPQCCVVCDGYIVCADSVQLGCGSCGGGGLYK